MPRSRTGGYLAPSSDLSACHAYSGVPIPQSTCPNLVWSYHNVPAKIVLFVAGQQGAVLSRSEWSPTWRERSKVISADPHWPAASPLCPALGSTICLRSFPHPCLPSSFQSPGASLRRSGQPVLCLSALPHDRLLCGSPWRFRGMLFLPHCRHASQTLSRALPAWRRKPITRPPWCTFYTPSRLDCAYGVMVASLDTQHRGDDAGHSRCRLRNRRG